MTNTSNLKPCSNPIPIPSQNSSTDGSFCGLWVVVRFVRIIWDKFFLTSEFLKKAGTNLASTDPDRPRFSELFRNARGTSLSLTTCLPILQYSTLQSCSMIILMSKYTRHRVLLSQFHLHLHYHSLLTLMQ